jgi:pSer/pThr/pTyr-binding forkhead associated (FHA) protein
MDKCPYCAAETRPGDNFCLNCGNRLPVPAGSMQQASAASGEATLPAEESWAPTVKSEPALVASASNGHDAPTVQANSEEAAAIPPIEKPAHLTLRTESGEVLQEFVLEKREFAIGRAPSSDILLSKDKLTSRRHATIHYENGEYLLQDERSANGTFVNGQQLEEKTPYKLLDGDHIGIGEYELIFQANAASGIDIESMPTMMVPPGGPAETYATREDPQLTATPNNDEFSTRPWEDGPNSPFPNIESPAPAAVASPEIEPAPTPAPVFTPAPVQTPAVVEMPAPVATPSAAITATTYESVDITFTRLNTLSQPQLPDVAPLMAALATLDGQVSSLQEQLNATHEAMHSHESDIAQITSQLRNGVRRVSERMDSTIVDVARSREQLAWAELLQLMEDVMNNPRDIEYVTKLARKARELNKVFQIHQNVLNTLAECTSVLRSLIGED